MEETLKDQEVQEHPESIIELQIKQKGINSKVIYVSLKKNEFGHFIQIKERTHNRKKILIFSLDTLKELINTLIKLNNIIEEQKEDMEWIDFSVENFTKQYD